MLDRLRVGIRDRRTVAITAKEGTPRAALKKIDRKLQMECGFEYAAEKKEWTRQMPSIMNMNRRREEGMGPRCRSRRSRYATGAEGRR